jgi:hypothetical protein
MIRMFMSYQNPIQVTGFESGLSHPLFDPAGANACINQQSSISKFENCGITGTATG